MEQQDKKFVDIMGIEQKVKVDVTISMFLVYFIFSAIFMLGYYAVGCGKRHKDIEWKEAACITVGGFIAMPFVLGTDYAYEHIQEMPIDTINIEIK